jgi:hypothetical protein
MKFEVIRHYKTKNPEISHFEADYGETLRMLISNNLKWINTSLCIAPETTKDTERLRKHLEICYALHLEERS